MKTNTGMISSFSLAMAISLWSLPGGVTYDVRLSQDPSGEHRLVLQRVERDESIEALRRIIEKDVGRE